MVGAVAWCIWLERHPDVHGHDEPSVIRVVSIESVRLFSTLIEASRSRMYKRFQEPLHTLPGPRTHAGQQSESLRRLGPELAIDFLKSGR
jgi:hypothetical protein